MNKSRLIFAKQDKKLLNISLAMETLANNLITKERKQNFNFYLTTHFPTKFLDYRLPNATLSQPSSSSQAFSSLLKSINENLSISHQFANKEAKSIVSINTSKRKLKTVKPF